MDTVEDLLSFSLLGQIMTGQLLVTLTSLLISKSYDPMMLPFK